MFIGAVDDFAVDTTSMVVLDSTTGTIRIMPKGGGSVVNLAVAQAKPLRVELDGMFAYWTNYLGGAVMRAVKDGSASPSVVAAASQPSEVVVDDTRVYWLNDADRSLRVSPKAGGTVTILHTAEALGALGPSSLTANATTLAFIAFGGGLPRAWTLPKLGGIASSLGEFQHVSLDEASLFGFYGGVGEGVLLRRPLVGAALWTNVWQQRSDAVVKAPAPPLVAEGGLLYFQYADGVYKIAGCGDVAPKIVAAGRAKRMRLDATHLYFSDGTSVRRVAK